MPCINNRYYASFYAFDNYCINKTYYLFENRLSDKFYFRIFAHVVCGWQSKLTTWGELKISEAKPSGINSYFFLYRSVVKNNVQELL